MLWMIVVCLSWETTDILSSLVPLKKTEPRSKAVLSLLLDCTLLFSVEIFKPLR